MSNKYIKHSHLSECQTREMLRYFCVDIEASKIAALTGISRQAVNRFLKALRECIAILAKRESANSDGSIEMDESYFGARRVRCTRGRRANGKHIVFGLIKRGSNVHTKIVATCSFK